jgi:hypothetical protein
MLTRIYRPAATFVSALIVACSAAMVVSCGNTPMGPGHTDAPAVAEQAQVPKPAEQPKPAVQENPPAPGIEVGEASTGEDAEAQP